MNLWIVLVILDVVVGVDIIRVLLGNRKRYTDAFMPMVVLACFTNCIALFGMMVGILDKSSYSYVYMIFTFLSAFCILSRLGNKKK